VKIGAIRWDAYFDTPGIAGAVGAFCAEVRIHFTYSFHVYISRIHFTYSFHVFISRCRKACWFTKTVSGPQLE
jgi:hypothetical protein